MFVKLKINHVNRYTEKAVCVNYKGNPTWFPLSMVQDISGKTIIIRKSYLDKKEIRDYKDLYNKPPQINPIFKQKPIKELRDEN